MLAKQLIQHDALRTPANARGGVRSVMNDRRQIGRDDLVRFARAVSRRDHFPQFVQFARPAIERQQIERIGADRSYLFAAGPIARLQKKLGQDRQIFQSLGQSRNADRDGGHSIQKRWIDYSR